MSEQQRLEIDCGESLTIADVGKLYAELLLPLVEGKQVSLDVSKIERIDTAAIQLLYAFCKEVRIQGYSVKWNQPSQTFCECVRLSGLAEQINIEDDVG